MMDRAASDFGAQLRLAREQRGVSLDQISHHTKIAVSVLEALEKNDVARLPGGIFTRAFVRSYAGEVGLDPERAVQDFIARFPQDPTVAARSGAFDAEENESLENERRLAQTVVKLVLLSVPIALVILYFVLTGRRASPSASEPARPFVEAPRVATNAGEMQAESEAPAEPIGTAGDIEATESADVVQELVVSLKTTDQCWVSASADRKRVLSRLLPGGDQVVLRAGREIFLTAGNGGALQLQINGENARPLGTPGSVVTWKITLDNYRTYLDTR
jgi:cytoskeletal protein RodZ